MIMWREMTKRRLAMRRGPNAMMWTIRSSIVRTRYISEAIRKVTKVGVDWALSVSSRAYLQRVLGRRQCRQLAGPVRHGRIEVREAVDRTHSRAKRGVMLETICTSCDYPNSTLHYTGKRVMCCLPCSILFAWLKYLATQNCILQSLTRPT